MTTAASTKPPRPRLPAWLRLSLPTSDSFHCTRACGFCAVKTAKPAPLETDEPARVAEATRRMGLKHVVITAVARDDLADGGADHFRRTICAVRTLNPGIVIEVLVPDFNNFIIHWILHSQQAQNL